MIAPKKKVKILIFPYGTEVSYEIEESLKLNKNFHILFATSDIQLLSLRKEYHHLPYVNEKTFTKNILNLANHLSIDVIIPAHDDAALELSKLESQISSKIAGQRQEVNEIVRYKSRTYEVLRDITSVPYVYRNPEDVRYPIFVKPNRGQGSKNAKLLKDSIEENMFFHDKSRSEYVYMEYLPGKEYTVDCFSQNSQVLYCNARIRNSTLNGISTDTRCVQDIELTEKFNDTAKRISKKLNLDGIWFFQIKERENGKHALLEVGARVSGNMMLNRMRGVNLVEAGVYRALGLDIEITPNSISEVQVRRTLRPTYYHTIHYKNLYIDFDDTLLIDNSFLNIKLMALIFSEKNNGKKITLITKNKKNNLAKSLNKFGISSIFDDIIHLSEHEEKVDYIPPGALFIDDSFIERKKAIGAGIFAYGIDVLDMFINYG